MVMASRNPVRPLHPHVHMSCLIHDSRLTSAIDLGHTLPPCLSPYQASSASSLLLLVMCIYASMHRSCLDGEPRLGVALAFTGARTCPHARSNARPVSACRGLATVAVVQKPRKARDVGLPWYIPGFETRVRIPGVTAVCGLSIPGLQPGFATCPIPGFSRLVLLGVAVSAVHDFRRSSHPHAHARHLGFAHARA